MQGPDGQGMQGPAPARPPARAPRRVAAPRRRSAAVEAESGAMAVAVGCPLPDGVEGATVPGPEAMDAVLLATLGADRVICQLVSAEFDALAVAARLAQIGFGGRLVVLCPTLPNPRMVEREIRHTGGGIKVELRQA